MTVNERIAKAVGWTEITPGRWVRQARSITEPIPAFDSSLDAMAIAEATLSYDQRKLFPAALARVMGCSWHRSDKLLFATAQQRAAAFLAVIEP